MNVELFLKTLPILLLGMAGIFIVTGILIVTVVVLNKIPAKRQKS